MTEKQTLFEHIRHPHVPRNVNDVHQAEQQGVSARIAVFLTRTVGSMMAAYIFVALALVGLFAILGLLNPIVVLLVAWTSQTFLQLVLLPVIMVGQNVLNRKQEIQAEEQFQTTEHSFHDIEQIMLHLNAQDAQLLKQIQMLDEMLDEIRKEETTR